MRKTLRAVSLFSFLLLSAGCVPVFFAAAGGVGMYAASKDAIQGETDVAFESLWDSAVTVSRVRGIIQKQDFDKGAIEMTEGKTRVWITLERITATATRLKVASRKYKLPNLDLAQLIYTKIIDQAKPVQK
jgi:hypothetical protein